MNDDLHDFQRFMKQREEVARVYVNGNAGPLGHIATRVSPATFFAPMGGYEEGAAHVYSTQEHDAKQFESGGDSRFEVLQMAVSDGLAYWVGLQRANARMPGKPDPVSFELRVTEIFRREGNDWKLVHRHADPLASPATSGAHPTQQ